jgi:exopolyphosphatase/guanosine-5'-triphosphate,3'-diphosphate pyrophosphatase
MPLQDRETVFGQECCCPLRENDGANVCHRVVSMPPDMDDDREPTHALTMASMDIGSHTARLLIAEKIDDSKLFRPILRKRVYIRLADDFENGLIKREAVDRALKALEDFASTSQRLGVDIIRAVSTGVVRKAGNRDRFLDVIRERTGIRVAVISGEKEARLTGKGVFHALNVHGRPFVIFDLGGGTTEFVFGQAQSTEVKSAPLGAMVLTQKHLTCDPPEENDLKRLEKHIAKILGDAFVSKVPKRADRLLVGTGGTVTTLAAMIHGIETDEIRHDNIHGLLLKREEFVRLFNRISTISFEERVKFPGLDRERADMIVAGAMVVGGILQFFQSASMVVSFSDILEGILIECLTEIKC